MNVQCDMCSIYKQLRPDRGYSSGKRFIYKTYSVCTLPSGQKHRSIKTGLLFE